MLKTLDEIKNAELSTTGVINGVDNANLMSVDSTAPVGDKGPDEAEKKDGEEEGKKKEEEKAKTEEETKKKEEEDKKKAEEEAKKKETQQDASKDPVAKRIGDLTRKWRSAERESSFNKSRAEKAEEELAKLKSKIPVTAKPKRDDFPDEDAYIEALVDWKAEEKIRAAQNKTEEATKKEKEKSEIQEVYQTVDSVVEKGREVYEDFDKVVFDENLVISAQTMETILQSEQAMEIFYFLGKNPDLAADISKMAPSRIGIEIGKIEVKLTAKEEVNGKEEGKPPAQPASEKKVVSKAPAPIEPPKETGAIEKDPNKMSPREYRAWREGKKG